MPTAAFLADQELPIEVPRVRDVARHREVPLSTYQQLQTPRSADVGLFRRVLGGISCREYEQAAEAVPEAFGPGGGEPYPAGAANICRRICHTTIVMEA